MPENNQSDFEIGYNYARQKHYLLTNRDSRFFLELGLAFLFEQGVTAELSKGMGTYYLEQVINLFTPENTHFSGSS
ncbi:hypothetical protein Sgly_2015 [Syntrophobotulus glycolicus DSM 8271]|uniref:Uncharacterized protein n=1 Tax=Syntrophobotulus glycolicus (strain DSM 8271 / FlGlyR) TaxID=645991 RepID=F0T1G7_SYNGF|nr:hypothetical protein [Syntrophobotulus glycolicus]ADY56308.1 hypothetical protein Sgly_2015 [Syntrophobotulus glycolicus DSM 8271]